MTTSESAVNEGSAAELSKELELLKHEEQTLLRIKEIIKRQLESLKEPREGCAFEDRLMLQNWSSSVESAHADTEASNGSSSTELAHANTEASVIGHCLDSSGNSMKGREESSLKQKVALEQSRLGLISGENRRAMGIEELGENGNDNLEIDETRNISNNVQSSSMALSALPVESCIRVSQIDQQSSITSELSALYLYENQKMPNYDFQTEDYTNLEPLKALTPEDLQMLGLPDSGGCEMENTEEIDQYWSSQVRISGEPVATSTQMASSLSVGNAMPELTMEDLNPYESFAFSASNVECEEEEEEDEQDEEQDAELNVKFL